MTSRPRLVLAVVAGLAAMLLYAGQFVLSRWTIQRTLSLWDLAALRFASAGLLLLPVVLRHGLASGGGVGWARSVALTITAGGPYTLIMFAGLSLAPAGHGAVIIPGATPVVSTALVWLWLAWASACSALWRSRSRCRRCCSGSGRTTRSRWSRPRYCCWQRLSSRVWFRRSERCGSNQRQEQ